MYARIVTFRLDGPSHAEYERQAVALADAFAAWPGLLAKVWLGDEAAGRYGGLYLFESAAAAEASRQTPEFLSLHHLPVFTDLRIEELEVLEAPTAVTGGPFTAVVAA